MLFRREMDRAHNAITSPVAVDQRPQKRILTHGTGSRRQCAEADPFPTLLPGRIYRCGGHRRRRQRLSVSDDSTQSGVLAERPMHHPKSIVARFAFRAVGSQNHRLLKMLVFQSAPQMTTNSLPGAAMPQPSRVSWLLVIELCEQEDISRSVGIADRGGPKACQNSPGPLSAWHGEWRLSWWQPRVYVHRHAVHGLYRRR